MNNTFHRLLLCIVSLTVFLFAVKSGNATLGGSVDSIESDRKVLSAVRGGVAVQNDYTVQEIDYGGTAVREYVSSSGVVFAIAWNGIRSPDLTTLLGSYADEYQKVLPSHSQNVLKEKCQNLFNNQCWRPFFSPYDMGTGPLIIYRGVVASAATTTYSTRRSSHSARLLQKPLQRQL
jgi:hypothetical protein